MKLAVIGASFGQLPLCLKAKELGHTVICFAWSKGAVCKDVVDSFYPISIFEKERILEICKIEGIDGVVSNASDATAEVVSFIATEMGLHGVGSSSFLSLKDKSMVRQLTANVPNLSQVSNVILTDDMAVIYPCILKPVTGNSKKGVVLAEGPEDLAKAKEYAMHDSDCRIILEQYIKGREVSVESISYEGKHYVLQITDKENGGAPHFVELSHHQPSLISETAKRKIYEIIPNLLDAVNFDNGASHIEMIVSPKEEIFLIEINPRGGGDYISSHLVYLSTGYDYIRGMIDVALGLFKSPVILDNKYSGVYFLSKQRENRLAVFMDDVKYDWIVDKQYDISNGLNEATGNYDRNGYLIYQAGEKIEID